MECLGIFMTFPFKLPTPHHKHPKFQKKRKTAITNPVHSSPLQGLLKGNAAEFQHSHYGLIQLTCDVNPEFELAFPLMVSATLVFLP